MLYILHGGSLYLGQETVNCLEKGLSSCPHYRILIRGVSLFMNPSNLWMDVVGGRQYTVVLTRPPDGWVL